MLNIVSCTSQPHATLKTQLLADKRVWELEAPERDMLRRTAHDLHHQSVTLAAERGALERAGVELEARAQQLQAAEVSLATLQARVHDAEQAAARRIADLDVCVR